MHSFSWRYLLEGDVDASDTEVTVEVVLECEGVQIELIGCTRVTCVRH